MSRKIQLIQYKREKNSSEFYYFKILVKCKQIDDTSKNNHHIKQFTEYAHQIVFLRIHHTVITVFQVPTNNFLKIKNMKIKFVEEY